MARTWWARTETRRAHRRQRAAYVRAALLLVAGDVASRFDWSPSAISDGVESVWGWALGVVQDWVIGPITRAASWAANQVADYAVALAQDVWEKLGILGEFAGTLWDMIVHMVDGAIDFALSIKNTLYDWIGDGIGWLWDTTSWWWEHVFNVLWDWLVDVVTSLIVGAIDLAMGAAGWVWDRVSEIAATVAREVLGAASWLYDNVRQIVTDMLGALFDAGSWLWERITDVVGALVSQLWDALSNGIAAVIAVVEGAWDFLVWVAEHPATWFAELIDGFFRNGSQWFIERLTDALSSSGSIVEDWLADSLR